jgi:hypothetical protein
MLREMDKNIHCIPSRTLGKFYYLHNTLNNRPEGLKLLFANKLVTDLKIYEDYVCFSVMSSGTGVSRLSYSFKN